MSEFIHGEIVKLCFKFFSLIAESPYSIVSRSLGDKLITECLERSVELNEKTGKLIRRREL